MPMKRTRSINGTSGSSASCRTRPLKDSQLSSLGWRRSGLRLDGIGNLRRGAAIENESPVIKLTRRAAGREIDCLRAPGSSFITAANVMPRKYLT